MIKYIAWQYGSHHVPSPHHWRGIALSTDSGQVQSVCVYGDYIYISNDFGMSSFLSFFITLINLRL